MLFKVLPANLNAKVRGMKRKQNLVRGMETEHRKGSCVWRGQGGAKRRSRQSQGETDTGGAEHTQCKQPYPPRSIVVYTQGRESGGSWYKTRSGVIVQGQGPGVALVCGHTRITPWLISKLAGESPSLSKFVAAALGSRQGGWQMGGSPPPVSGPGVFQVRLESNRWTALKSWSAARHSDGEWPCNTQSRGEYSYFAWNAAT
jgi:hypothetical protein